MYRKVKQKTVSPFNLLIVYIFSPPITESPRINRTFSLSQSVRNKALLKEGFPVFTSNQLLGEKKPVTTGRVKVENILLFLFSNQLP